MWLYTRVFVEAKAYRDNWATLTFKTSPNKL